MQTPIADSTDANLTYSHTPEVEAEAQAEAGAGAGAGAARPNFLISWKFPPHLVHHISRNL